MKIFCYDLHTEYVEALDEAMPRQLTRSLCLHHDEQLIWAEFIYQLDFSEMIDQTKANRTYPRTLARLNNT